MVQRQNKKPKKRNYPEFWNIFIPAAVILITAVIVFLIFITVRVALGLNPY